MAEKDDFALQAVDGRPMRDGRLWIPLDPSKWNSVLADSKNSSTWRPGCMRAETAMEKCEKCGLPVVTMRDVNGQLVVSDVIQLGAVITKEQAAQPQGEVITDFKIQTMPHLCPPAEIAKIIREDQ